MRLDISLASVDKEIAVPFSTHGNVNPGDTRAKYEKKGQNKKADENVQFVCHGG